MRKLNSPAIKTAPDGILQDGGGLFLRNHGGGGRWFWRYMRMGRRRDMGLGSYPQVSLADARKFRDDWTGSWHPAATPSIPGEVSRTLRGRSRKGRIKSSPN